MKLATLHTGFNPAEVQLVRSRLEAAGFHPFVPNENSALGTEGYTLAVGGIRIQVPECEFAEARDFLESSAQ